MTPLDQAKNLNRIRFIATDIDGTLTIHEKFSAKLLEAFDRLNQAGIQVLIVTGRSAGWVSALANYSPIWGEIAENGGLFY
jgi:HAD superfamily hydrolase (TIGR01484 family)